MSDEKHESTTHAHVSVPNIARFGRYRSLVKFMSGDTMRFTNFGTEYIAWERQTV